MSSLSSSSKDHRRLAAADKRKTVPSMAAWKMRWGNKKKATGVMR